MRMDDALTVFDKPLENGGAKPSVAAVRTGVPYVVPAPYTNARPIQSGQVGELQEAHAQHGAGVEWAGEAVCQVSKTYRQRVLTILTWPSQLSSPGVGIMDAM